MRVFKAEEARRFADQWLPAWSGNDPRRLVDFYSEDAFYSDPAVPGGLRGKPALLAYFTRLLRRYPDWEWSHVGSIPLEDGFVNRWHARVPACEQVREINGVCLVQIDGAGKIFNNEVYFDPRPLTDE